MPLQSHHMRNGWRAWQASSRESGSYLQSRQKLQMSGAAMCLKNFNI